MSISTICAVFCWGGGEVGKGIVVRVMIIILNIGVWKCYRKHYDTNFMSKFIWTTKVPVKLGWQGSGERGAAQAKIKFLVLCHAKYLYLLLTPISDPESPLFCIHFFYNSRIYSYHYWFLLTTPDPASALAVFLHDLLCRMFHAWAWV